MKEKSMDKKIIKFNPKHFSSKRTSLASKDMVIRRQDTSGHRRTMTRNLNVKQSEDSHRFFILDKSANLSLSKIKHKRSGSSLVGEMVKVNEPLALKRSTFSKSKERMRLSKDILKRLKRKSNFQVKSGLFKKYSIDKSRAEQFHMYTSSQGNFSSFGEGSKRQLKTKDFPLPKSTTSKKLKKAIEARLK